MRFNFLYKAIFSVCIILVSSCGVIAQKQETDFKVKGFHLDLRIQVMTPAALKDFADQLAEFGMNTLVMEYEATYPFKKHATITNEYSYTREEVEEFIAYCNSLGIEVVPLQQSLGHLEYILRNPRYSELKEDRIDISQVCPMKIVESKQLFTELFTDMADMHDSEYIHIGGDETRLLGHCELCKARVEEVGTSKLFVDYMSMITQIVVDLGKKPVMWADIILKHPEAAQELPKETIFVDWNYGWKINHFGDIPALQEKGFSFWGSPAIRSHPDNWYVTDWKTHFKNQRDFIPYSRDAGYEGMVMTSWSTSGVYGFTWDVDYSVVDMVQLRNTYPLSGFRILIASYAEALKTKDTLDTKKFIESYAKTRFGLATKDIQRFVTFLDSKPELIVNGTPKESESIAAMIDYLGAIRDELALVNVNNNKDEFAHFKLMADLRIYYLNFKQVEAAYNSVDYTSDQAPQLLKQLDSLLAEAKILNTRFYNLNKGFLYDAELEDQNALRLQQVEVLYDRLSKLK
ncbi:family 20 glycosylhydrolase [Leeuwenhoekiella sp. MAR_2009_132]|uniref:family 20 glycosylhydrolase n=1 Tax=Leeuwenhoekiella sp. MAR_2009_132 TaxID=1392489 RepID=UPI0009DF4CA2|nr:family 20 glycosylhydrolase [Leeuwenhoekiella sp. MAR_2009_132]